MNDQLSGQLIIKKELQAGANVLWRPQETHGWDLARGTAFPQMSFLTYHFRITMTSQWVGWRLKSPASRLFTQPFILAQIKENIKALHHWPLRRELTGDRWIPGQMASNAETFSIWWRHHVCCYRHTIRKITISWKLIWEGHHAQWIPSNANIFRVIDPLCWEFTGHRWIPLTNVSDAEL